jgi:hypothetical protein
MKFFVLNSFLIFVIQIFLCSLFFPLLPFFCVTLPYLHRHQPVNVFKMNEIKSIQFFFFSSIQMLSFTQKIPMLLQIQWSKLEVLHWFISISWFLFRTNHVRWTDKIIYFYRAPIVRFYYNLVCIFIEENDLILFIL